MTAISKYQAPIIAGVSAFLCSVVLFIPFNFSIFLKIVLFFVFIIVPQIFVCIHGKDNVQEVTKNSKLVFENAAVDSDKDERIQFLEAELQEYRANKDRFCEDFFTIALNAAHYSPVLSELCDSISTNLSSTTEPLSVELLQIRKNINTFLSGVKQYEEEVKNHYMLNKVAEESDLLESDMTMLDKNVHDVFFAIGEKVNQLKTIHEKIGIIANNINNVSERIRILSFNASIEAARAGKAGAGFRVIASEIKKLSFNTETHLDLIWKTLKETQNIFDSLKFGIDENSTSIYSVLSNRKEGLSTFITVIQGYFDNFDHLYTSVNEIISSLSSSMDSIAPVIQLHEITNQEISNMKLVIEDFIDMVCKKYTKQSMSKELTLDPTALHELVFEIVKNVRKRLTTERELRALERGIYIKTPDEKINLGMNTNAIELF